ncbi:hypothetical protein HU200_057072 [Digitaria exilis]|uniref:Uncharacterized protein n=1 Tax=Digitaria exilis TaxID=1010633 RepID=A0A835E0A1_9POAL|nr:hypothetical protein HU200_057072 [Digitaria exilis]
MDLAQLAVANADAKVDAMLRSGAGRHGVCTTHKLGKCQRDYAAVTSTIPVCRAMAEDYKKPDAAKNLAAEDYFGCPQRLRRSTFDCMERILFGGDELGDMLFGAVHQAFERAILVEAMLEEMLGVVSNDHGPKTVAPASTTW